MNTPTKIVLAYSGGLDTSVILAWLVENYGCPVVAYCGDVGQGLDEVEGLHERAIKSGASEFHFVDLKREFIEDFCYPMLMAGARYEGRYLLGTSIARPLLARAQVEVARKTGADAVAHGCTGKGNDQIRFEATFAALAPDLQVIAPWREWSLRGREDLINYLKQRNIPTNASATKAYSRDKNLWHVSHEGGGIEDPWNPPPDDAWMMTVSPEKAPDAPRDVLIDIEGGRPVAVDGKRMPGEALVEHLNTVAGEHGVGRIDLVENRVVGMKSRGLYETPGGAVLFEAIRGLEELVLDRQTLRLREELALQVADLIYEGKWYTPKREALMAAVDAIARPLHGQVVVRLFKGAATAVRRRSPNSLYSEDYATFSKDEVYNQKDATGFIRLFTLPERIRALTASHAARTDRTGAAR
ncbi:MAG: argininosuccinate synthase [Phycisphaeraceae bacterium]|nr:argininosuccinate synthase [Phycisphaeraceae bacterium]